MARFTVRIVALLMAVAGVVRLSAQVPLVVTTHPVHADVARQLGADDVEVACLVPAGTSLRLYEPNEAGIRLLARARIVITHGLELDAWIEAMIRESGFAGEVVVATDRMPVLDLQGVVHDPEEESERDSAEFDPNTWHDPRTIIHAARVIAVALADLVPTRATEIEERLRVYTGELQALHTYATEQFESLPPERRRVATSHGEFAYLAATYGLQIGLIPGFEPGRVPQPAQMAHLIEIVKPLGVPAIFLHAGTSPLAAKELREAAGVRVVTTLFTDTLGEPGSTTGSYIQMFRRNVDQIVGALK